MPVLDGQKIVAGLRGRFAKEVGRQALLQYAADHIKAAGEPYTGVYLYMMQSSDLVLEAHAGRVTDHTRIAVGQGVCGTAVALGQDQNVPDVRGRDNYLACNLETRAELVALIRRGDEILGQIDIDSDTVDPFTPAEHAEVRRVADALAVLL
jgi:L-methionine (R)-S-oxide reductase